MKLITVALTLGFCILGGQEKQACHNHPRQLLDKQGKPVRLSSAETKKRVVHCEIPKLPGTVDAEGMVLVMVLINPDGEVECAVAWAVTP